MGYFKHHRTIKRVFVNTWSVLSHVKSGSITVLLFELHCDRTLLTVLKFKGKTSVCTKWCHWHSKVWVFLPKVICKCSWSLSCVCCFFFVFSSLTFPFSTVGESDNMTGCGTCFVCAQKHRHGWIQLWWIFHLSDGNTTWIQIILENKYFTYMT